MVFFYTHMQNNIVAIFMCYLAATYSVCVYVCFFFCLFIISKYLSVFRTGFQFHFFLLFVRS